MAYRNKKRFDLLKHWFTYYFNKFDRACTGHLRFLSLRTCKGRYGWAAVDVARLRRQWQRRRIAEFGEILAKSEIPDDKLSIASYYFFERLKLWKKTNGALSI